MIPSALLLATAQTIPWNLSVGITMTLANLVAFVIGYFATVVSYGCTMFTTLPKESI